MVEPSTGVYRKSKVKSRWARDFSGRGGVIYLSTSELSIYVAKNGVIYIHIYEL